MSEEMEKLRTANALLLGLLPKLKAPCVYCGLDDISRCESGFPGCAQADNLMCAEDEALKRVLHERNQLRAQVAQLREACAERDRLQGQVAHMCEVLERIALDDAENFNAWQPLAHEALSIPAPAMVPADKARVLAEALAYIDAREEIGYVSYCGMTNNRIRVEEALAIARELGLLEESDERRRD